LKGIFVVCIENYKAYKFYNLSQQKVVASQDVKLDKDARPSKSQESPTEMEVEKLAASKSDSQVLDKSKLDQLDSNSDIETIFPSSSVKRSK
jgi:hypothetical protein